MSSVIRLGSRKSRLALAQTEAVRTTLNGLGLASEIVTFDTTGDRVLDVALSKIGDKGLFTRELEEALLAGQIDGAVHSMKDLPAAVPDGLQLLPVLPREDPRDALVLPEAAGSFVEAASQWDVDTVRAHLPERPRLGTSSLRRVAQLTRLFPGADFVPVRGNLQTRLAKLEAGEVDALVLAAAGLHRLALSHRIAHAFDPVASCVPAVSQGVLALETTAGSPMHHSLAPLIQAEVAAATVLERRILLRLQGGCQVPLAAYAQPMATGFLLTGLVASLDGQHLIRHQRQVAWQAGMDETALIAEADAVADALLADGAADIISSIRQQARR